MPSVRIMTSGWSGSAPALQRLKKGRSEYIAQKNFDAIEEQANAKCYRLKRQLDGTYKEGVYTMEEALKIMNGRMLSLYIMEPVS